MKLLEERIEHLSPAGVKGMIQMFHSIVPLAIKFMLVVLMILAFALGLADQGMQMPESNH